MYKDFLVLDGTLETVEEINAAINKLTGDTGDFFDTENEEWRAWVEYRNGQTIILADCVD